MAPHLPHFISAQGETILSEAELRSALIEAAGSSDTINVKELFIDTSTDPHGALVEMQIARRAQLEKLIITLGDTLQLSNFAFSAPPSDSKPLSMTGRYALTAQGERTKPAQIAQALLQAIIGARRRLDDIRSVSMGIDQRVLSVGGAITWRNEDSDGWSFDSSLKHFQRDVQRVLGKEGLIYVNLFEVLVDRFGGTHTAE